MALKVLLDTSAILALMNPEDAFHQQALTIKESLVAQSVAFVLPNFLLAESHTIINKRMGASSSREFLNAALQDFEIERVTIEDEWTAHAILQETNSKRDFSYFDAVAVALAERLGIRKVFTFDQHFKIMGLELAKP